MRVSSTWFATRGPTICSSTDGAIGSPSRRIASSVSSTVFPCSTASISTVVIRVSTRLTMKAGASAERTGRLRSCLTVSQTVARVASSVSAARITSTSGRTATGLKKCIPATRSGCWSSAAISVTDNDEVFVASTHSGDTTRSSSAKTSRLT